ncbi:MAG TPA: hypothetical protein VMB34_16030 [Acetobacteraceae bacterium]|nr:hypothetical protein [Acetobacteraceae bacterium]
MTETIGLGAAFALALMATVMSSGPAGRQGGSNWIHQAFTPSLADLGAIVTARR